MKIRSVISITILFFLHLSCGNVEQDHSSSDGPSTPPTSFEEYGIEVYDSSALSIIDPNAPVETLAEGFYWAEGPVWVEELNALLFSDVPVNKIYKWSEKDSLSVFMASSGHSGKENVNSDRGSNGLMLDMQNRLLLCQHGDQRVARLATGLSNPENNFVTLADNYAGKPFNSPNDLTMDRTGNVYFSDPPYGRPGNETGEIGYNGVFRISNDNEVSLLIDSLSKPNGIALSKDEQILYINQSDPLNPVLYSYEISEDDSLINGKILFDFSEQKETMVGSPDGLKVHKSGNIFATGPGGVHIISSAGKHLALIQTIKATANCTFDSNQEYLYMTTTDMLLRVKLNK